MAPRPAPLDPPLPVDRRFREYADGRRPEVLGEVFETVAPELLAVGRCMGLDEHLAQDALQETFLVLIRRAGEFRPERSFLPWATGIFVRQASSARRRAARRPAPEADPPRPVRTPSEELEAREAAVAVERACAELPDTYREIVRATLVDELPPRELARRHGLTANAAAVRVHRGLRLLRAALPPAIAAAVASGAANARALEAVRPVVLARARRAALLANFSGALAVSLVLLVGGVLALVAWGGGGEPVRAPDAPELAAADGRAPAPRHPPRAAARAPADPADGQGTAPGGASPPEPEAAPTRAGRLLLPGGAAAPAGIEVLVLETDARGGFVPPTGPLAPAAVSDGEGRFALPLAALEAVEVPLLYCRFEDAAAWRRLAGADAPGEPGELVLQLEEAAAVACRVTDAGGAPLPGARVRVAPVRLPFAPVPDGYQLERAHRVEAGYGAVFGAVAGEDGVALVRGIPPQRGGTPLVVRAEAEGYAGAVLPCGVDGTETLEVALALTPLDELALEGRVETELGAAIAGARIALDHAGDLPVEGRVVAESGPDGRFALGAEGLPGFPLRLRISAPGRVDAVLPVFEAAALPWEPVAVVLVEPAPLSGRVVDGEGRPVAGGRVRLANADGLFERRSDAEGAFAFDAAGPGPLQVWCEPPAGRGDLFESGRVQLGTERPDVELELPALPRDGPRVEVRVLDAATGRRVAAARAELRPVLEPDLFPTAWPARELELHAAGVSVETLPPGRWGVYVDAAPHGLGCAFFDVAAGAGQVDVDVPVGRAGAIEATLLPGRSPWRQIEARLELETAAPGWFSLGEDDGHHTALEVDQPGDRARLEGLQPGPWVVTAWSLGDRARERVHVRAGATAELVLEARPMAVLDFVLAERTVPVTLVVDVSYDGGETWSQELESVILPHDDAPRIVPVEPGLVHWRTFYLHPYRRECDAHVFYPTGDFVEVEPGDHLGFRMELSRTGD